MGKQKFSTKTLDNDVYHLLSDYSILGCVEDTVLFITFYREETEVGR